VVEVLVLVVVVVVVVMVVVVMVVVVIGENDCVCTLLRKPCSVDIRIPAADVVATQSDGNADRVHPSSLLSCNIISDMVGH
jgi:hypothetical protein